MDRAVITRHLLNDATDPFNRQPLSVEDLKSDVTMLQKIQSWKQSCALKKEDQQERTPNTTASAAGQDNEAKENSNVMEASGE